MLGRTGVAPYGRRCSWAHSEGHIGVAHYGILVGGPFQLRWQPIGRRCLWAYLGEVPTNSSFDVSKPLHLRIVLLVPYIKKILFSISKFTVDDNVLVEFDSFHCHVKDKVTKKVLVQGHLCNDCINLMFPHRIFLLPCSLLLQIQSTTTQLHLMYVHLAIKATLKSPCGITCLVILIQPSP